MYPQRGFLQEATLWACMRGYGRVGGEVAWGSIGMSIGIMIEIEIEISIVSTRHHVCDGLVAKVVGLLPRRLATWRPGESGACCCVAELLSCWVGVCGIRLVSGYVCERRGGDGTKYGGLAMWK